MLSYHARVSHAFNANWNPNFSRLRLGGIILSAAGELDAIEFLKVLSASANDNGKEIPKVEIIHNTALS